MKLIIAEKPSLGRNIVDAINGIGKEQMQKKSGYYEGAGYIVSWAFGHLFSLSDIEFYTENGISEEKPRWKMDNLPCFPDKFNFSLKKRRQTAIVNKLLKVSLACCNRT